MIMTGVDGVEVGSIDKSLHEWKILPAITLGIQRYIVVKTRKVSSFASRLW